MIRMRSLILIGFFIPCLLHAKTISLTVAAGMLVVPLRSVMTAESQWTSEAVVSEFTKVNKIYEQCGVQFSPLILSTQTFPTQLDEKAIDAIADDLLRKRIRHSIEPVVIFSGAPNGSLQSRLGGAMTAGLSYASITNRPHLENIAIVFEIVRTKSFHDLRPPGYSTVAHELAHVFLDSDHVRRPNLLAKSMEQLNTELSPGQCETLRKSPLVQTGRNKGKPSHLD